MRYCAFLVPSGRRREGYLIYPGKKYQAKKDTVNPEQVKFPVCHNYSLSKIHKENHEVALMFCDDFLLLKLFGGYKKNFPPVIRREA